MNRSETIGKIAEALAKAQGSMKTAKKVAANPFYKSRYADLATVVEVIREPFSVNGLSYVQLPDTDEQGNVTLETIFMHTSGEWFSSVLTMKPAKNDPQTIGSLISYMRRYALQAMAGMASEDDDGNAASEHPVKPQMDVKQQIQHAAEKVATVS